MNAPQPWQVLGSLPAWQITEIPRPRDSGNNGGARDTGDRATGPGACVCLRLPGPGRGRVGP